MKQLLVACAFVYHDGKFLTAKRAATKTFLPNKFELPGGHVEYGETFEECLHREFAEELNLKIKVGQPLAAFTYINPTKQAHSAEIIFLCELEQPKAEIKLNPEDHSEFAWVPEAELEKYYDVNDEEYKGIKKCFAVLKNVKRIQSS